MLLELLTAGATVADAARAAGMSERSAYRRLSDRGFRRRLDDAEGEQMRRALARLTALQDRALVTLEQLLDADQPGHVRARAVGIAIDARARLREQLVVEDRLAEVEQAVARLRPSRPLHPVA